MCAESSEAIKAKVEVNDLLTAIQDDIEWGQLKNTEDSNSEETEDQNL